MYAWHAQIVPDNAQVKLSYFLNKRFDGRGNLTQSSQSRKEKRESAKDAKRSFSSQREKKLCGLCGFA
jgi:hypothetical protein